MKKFTRKRAVVTGIVAVAVLAISGVAVAYWTSSGSGTGSATTGTATNDLSFTQTSSNTGLAPGVAAEGITGTVENTQSVGGNDEYVSSVTVSISSVTETAGEITDWGSDGDPGTDGTYTCSASDYTLSNTTMTVDTDIAPQASADFSGASIAFNDLAGTNQDACQGATVNLAFTSN